jgi:hypothetical protein
MVNGPNERRAWSDKWRSGRLRPPAGARLTGSWARPIHSALVWQGSGGRLRREAHVSAEQHRPQATARVSRPHGDRRRPARDRAEAGQRAQAPVLLSVATLLRVRLGRMRGHRGSGGPPEAAPPISRRGRDALPLCDRGLHPTGGPAWRAERDWHRLHRQSADRQCGRPQSGAAPAAGGGARDPSRRRQAWL